MTLLFDNIIDSLPFYVTNITPIDDVEHWIDGKLWSESYGNYLLRLKMLVTDLYQWNHVEEMGHVVKAFYYKVLKVSDIYEN